MNHFFSKNHLNFENILLALSQKDFSPALACIQSISPFFLPKCTSECQSHPYLYFFLIEKQLSRKLLEFENNLFSYFSILSPQCFSFYHQSLPDHFEFASNSHVYLVDSRSSIQKVRNFYSYFPSYSQVFPISNSLLVRFILQFLTFQGSFFPLSLILDEILLLIFVMIILQEFSVEAQMHRRERFCSSYLHRFFHICKLFLID